MRATVIYGAGDVRVEDVPDPALQQPTDAVVRVLRSCICGSDLWPYGSMPASEQGRRIGHEFLGVVEDVGAEVSGLKAGDVVVAPFVWADNTCDFCREGLQTSCRHGGIWGAAGVDGGQGEAVRVPQAQGTLVKLPVGEDSALLPSLLTLSDVFPTGHHCAVTAGVNPRTTVTVIGDGAVGLCAVLAAKRLGAEQIILMGRHKAPHRPGPRVRRHRRRRRARRGGHREGPGADRRRRHPHRAGVRRPAAGGRDRVRASSAPAARSAGSACRSTPTCRSTSGTFLRNITLTGGVAPARAYIEELLPDVLEGTVEPGKVFDRTVDLDGVPDGYRAMADREALKVLVRP